MFGLLATSGCGDGRGRDSSILEGTSVNPDYADGRGPPAKMVFTKNTLAFYKKLADAAPYGTGHWVVEEDWTADEGRYFQCKLTNELDSTDVYWLVRTSDSNTFEAQISTTEYPSVVDPSTVDSATRAYGIWTRQS